MVTLALKMLVGRKNQYGGRYRTPGPVPTETPFSGAAAHNALLILHPNPSVLSRRKTKEDC